MRTAWTSTLLRNARQLPGLALLALPLLAHAAPATSTAAAIRTEAGFLVMGYRICAHAYPDFAAKAAPAWAEFRKRFPAAWAEGMKKARHVEQIADQFPSATPEEDMEQLSNCADLLEPGGFDPTRKPDPRLATPQGALEMLEQAVINEDRTPLPHVLMGRARQRVLVAFDSLEDPPHPLLRKIIHADRVALAAAAPTVDALDRGFVRGPEEAPSLLIEKVRGEWRVANL